MSLIYRSMLIDRDKPSVGSDTNMLGVRVPPHPRPDIASKILTERFRLRRVRECPLPLPSKPWQRSRSVVSRRLRGRFPHARAVDDLVT